MVDRSTLTIEIIRGVNGRKRHDDNVLSISGVELDYDGKKVSFAKAAKIMKSARLAALLYTSPSYTEAAPKWRILLPTSNARGARAIVVVGCHPQEIGGWDTPCNTLRTSAIKQR